MIFFPSASFVLGWKLDGTGELPEEPKKLPKEPNKRAQAGKRACFRVIFSVPSGMRVFPGGSDSKESARNAGDPGSIPGLGRSPGEGNGSPLRYSCLENPTDRGAWRAVVHRQAESDTKVRHDGATNTLLFLFLGMRVGADKTNTEDVIKDQSYVEHFSLEIHL